MARPIEIGLKPLPPAPIAISTIELQSQIDSLDAKIEKILDSVSKTSDTESNRPGKRSIQELDDTLAQNGPIKPNQKPRAAIIPKISKPKSFVEALKAPTPKETPKTTTYRERRLILQDTAKLYPVVESRSLRDKINKAFEQKLQILTPVVGTVTKSLKGGDIVLSTTEKFDAEFLRKNEAV